MEHKRTSTPMCSNCTLGKTSSCHQMATPAACSMAPCMELRPSGTCAAIAAAVRTQQLDSRGSAWLKASRHGSFATVGTECMPSTPWAGTAPESSRSRMWTQASASTALREDWSVSSCPLEAPASAHWRTPRRVEIRLASSFEGFCDLWTLQAIAQARKLGNAE